MISSHTPSSDGDKVPRNEPTTNYCLCLHAFCTHYAAAQAAYRTAYAIFCTQCARETIRCNFIKCPKQFNASLVWYWSLVTHWERFAYAQCTQLQYLPNSKRVQTSYHFSTTKWALQPSSSDKFLLPICVVCENALRCVCLKFGRIHVYFARIPVQRTHRTEKHFQPFVHSIVFLSKTAEGRHRLKNRRIFHSMRNIWLLVRK